jgi:hypothetical protein
MGRKKSIRQQVKEITETHENYEYALWRCTGRHRVPIIVLGDSQPENCGWGHSFKFITKVPASKALKSYLKKMLNSNASE